MKNRNYILASDSHIRTDTAEKFFTMLEQIDQYGPAGVIFLGDIFELWIALDGYESDIHFRFLDWCRTAKDRFEVGFITGNHEFYVQDRHRDAFTWMDDVDHITESGMLFTHGDLINQADKGYLLLRRFLRNKIIRFLLKTTAGTIGPKISDCVLKSLKPTNQQHKRQLPMKFLEQYAQTASEKKIRKVFAGHFHQYKKFDFPEGGRMEILPAWETAEEIILLKPDLQTLCGPWKILLQNNPN